MGLRRLELPAITDIGGEPEEQIIVEISLIKGDMLPTSAFSRVAGAISGVRPKRYVLTESIQEIELIPTDELYPLTWYLVTIYRQDAPTFYRCQIPSLELGGADPMPWDVWINIQEGVDSGVLDESQFLPVGQNDGDLAVFDAVTGTWVAMTFATNGVGDMMTMIYDPQDVAADAFDLANIVGTVDCGEP